MKKSNKSTRQKTTSKFLLIYYTALTIITVIISIIVTSSLLSANIPLFNALTHTMISFISITALLIIPKPFFKSYNWFYKLIFSVLYCTAMYSCSHDYIMSCYADNEYYIIKWLIIWTIPVLIYYTVCLIDRSCTNLYKKKHCIGIIWKSWTVNYSPLKKANQNKKKNKLRLTDLPSALIFLIASFCIAVTIYLKLQFSNADLGVIMYTLRFKTGGINETNLRTIIIILTLVTIANIFFTAHSINTKNTEEFRLISPDRSESFTICKEELAKCVLKDLPLLSLLVVSVCLILKQVNFKDYIININRTSTIYENYFVQPDMSLLTFPEKKKNLIYISAESMENAYASFSNGGVQSTDLIPNLVKLSKSNINFSNSQHLGGQSVFYPSVSYTMGSCVAQTSGISFLPYMNPMINKSVYESELLPSAVKLETILSSAGYNQLYIKGDKATFAGANYYFGHENNSRIVDYVAAQKEGLIPERYYKNWGIEDAKVFDISKELISQAAQKKEPFAVTIYTMDTHMPEGGFRCELCDPNIKNNQIAAVKCSDRQISDFVKWVQEQEFADDTVIIIYGDHLSHNNPRSLFRKMPYNYIQTTYNCIINAQKRPVNEKNRTFTAMDMYPTTLSALGVTIKGNRLGLGTDLFSDTPTLCEEMGKGKFLQQIQSNSDYFKREFLKEAS